ARVKAMFHPPDGSEGLIAETRRLRDAALLGPQAAQCLGTKQVLQYIDGKLTEIEAIEKVKIETRRFAKNQRTWLKRYRNVHWIDASTGSFHDHAAPLLGHIRAHLRPLP